MVTTLLTALITAGGVLFATWLANRHNRQLKLIELREGTARTIRQEKREVYLELLRANRRAVQYAVQISHMGLDQQLAVDLSAMNAASDRFGELIPELELVASREVYELSQELYRAMGRCNEKMYLESEQRFVEFDLMDKEPSPEQKIAIWEEVLAEVQKLSDELGMELLYSQLRNCIREELGFLALDPSLVPTAEELKKLRKELSNLDQLKLRSDTDQP
jgi:hypothetical protein